MAKMIAKDENGQRVEFILNSLDRCRRLVVIDIPECNIRFVFSDRFSKKGMVDEDSQQAIDSLKSVSFISPLIHAAVSRWAYVILSQRK